jgi:hypothetical protein
MVVRILVEETGVNRMNHQPATNLTVAGNMFCLKWTFHHISGFDFYAKLL